MPITRTYTPILKPKIKIRSAVAYRNWLSDRLGKTPAEITANDVIEARIKIWHDPVFQDPYRVGDSLASFWLLEIVAKEERS